METNYDWKWFSKHARSKTSYVFLSLALWPLICCGDECQYGVACTAVALLAAVLSFVTAELVRELWLLRFLRGY